MTQMKILIHHTQFLFQPVVLEKERAILKERDSMATLKVQKYQLNDNTNLTLTRKTG